MFNEKQFKDYSKKFAITIKRNKDDLLSSWQISNLVSQISSQYYKNELLNTISLALNNGVQPENIFIFTDSFSINNSYLKLNILDLDDSSDVKTLYHLGKPISLFPNDFSTKINLVFDYFRKISELLNRQQDSTINKDFLLKILEQIKKNVDISDILSSINEHAIPSLPKEKKIEIDNRIKNIYRDKISKYQKYKKDNPEIDLILKDISSQSKIFDISKKQQLEADYFNKFFLKFRNLKRPVVAIYHPEENKIQIICNNFINKNERDERFLDIKSISHNSPYIVYFFIGIGIAIPLFKVIKFVKETNGLKRQSDYLEKEELKTDKELDEILEKMSMLTNSTENQASNNIGSLYLKEKITSAQEQNNEKFKASLKHYGFINRKMDVKVLDIEK